MKKIALKTYGLLTVLESAAELGVNPQTIRNWIAAESLPVVVIPGERESYLIRVADLRKVRLPVLGRPKK